MPLDVEVVSPEEELYAGEADFVLARTVEGDIGILPGHTPILAQLARCEVKVTSGGSSRTFPIGGGFMSVKDNKVIILAEEPASGGGEGTAG